LDLKQEIQIQTAMKKNQFGTSKMCPRFAGCPYITGLAYKADNNIHEGMLQFSQ
jgi:hypothetical protein